MPRPSLELIASAQGGDAAALAALLAAAQPDIRRYARVTCTAADVDDAVQDALCVLHRHESQQKPLKPGSAEISLTKILGTKN